MQPGAWSGQDTIEELLVRHCADAGDRIAFADARRSVTYSELLAKTAAVASRLRSLGVGRGDRVIVRLGNTVEFVEYCLGVTRAAAVGVPVSPRATEAELAYLIEDSGAVALVTQHDQLARDREGLRVVGVDDAALEPGTPIPDVLGPDEPAWLLYTSGTSGEPKGVLSTQRSALWAAATGFGEVLGLDGNDTVLWPLPMHHSFSHSMALLGNLVTGACTRIVADGAGPKALSELLARHPGAVLAGVPATYAQLVQQGRTAAPRFCLSAGAVMPDALRHAVEDTFQAPLIDGYGSTETCGLIAVQRPGEPRVVGSCGTPLPGVAVRVVEGELLVRTPGLMLGYHGRPQETANALADGWFRTGDSGRIDDSGLVTVTGRMDEILVCGGENVHPTEIEQVLLTIPSVQDVIVVGRPHEILGEVPVALVIPGPNGFDPIGLRQACAARLPEYKVPVDFLAVTAIARTASGKPLRRLMAGAAQIDMAARRAELRELPAVRRRTALNDLVRTETLAAYGRAAERGWAPGQPFADAGLSSLGAVLLRTRLSDRTGLPLPETLAYDFPTPAAVVGHLDSLLSGAVADTPVPATKPVDPDPVVIVSMACRYPGGVRSPADLWRLVNGETDAIGDFPTDRGWDMARLYDPDPDRIGRTYVLRGGFLDDPASFDAGLFGMSPREALATDPQQRLLLETAWEALERAGIDAATLRGSDTGVFVGVMYDDYAGRFTEHELEAQLGIGSAHSVASGRISYVFDFIGPTLSVDTACSSSLVALHLAVRALRGGECSLAMVGGATVLATPNPFVAFSRQRGLSPSGVCRSYADGADGTVWAEGVGLLLLEKLSDAHRNGHPVLATIRGSAVNSD
ncbi:MAG TPA: beta-ketoacyl synthase N-terminal-like domain-containing protein, partial [Pseudonocardiaceae bacterium]